MRAVVTLALLAGLASVASVLGCASEHAPTTPDADTTPKTVLTGRVTDGASAPVSRARIQLCGTACQLAVADDAGQFEVVGVVDAPHHYLDVRGPTGDPRSFATLVVRINVPVSVRTEAPVARLPLLPAKIALGVGAQTISIDDKLTLAFDGSALSFPSDERFVRGVRVPESAWPAYDVGASKILALWALDPFDVVAAKPIGVRISEAFGLPAGTKLSLHTVRSDQGTALRASSAAVTSDGSIETPLGEGLDRLAWIALVKDP